MRRIANYAGRLPWRHQRKTFNSVPKMEHVTLGMPQICAKLGALAGKNITHHRSPFFQRVKSAPVSDYYPRLGRRTSYSQGIEKRGASLPLSMTADLFR